MQNCEPITNNTHHHMERRHETMKKTYYKREYYDNKKGRFVTKVSTDIGKLVAKNEVFGIARADGTVRDPPVTRISKREYEILKRGWGDDSIARPVYWFDVVKGIGDNNDGYIYGIEYMDGEEIADCEWFETEAQRDSVLKEYFENVSVLMGEEE